MDDREKELARVIEDLQRANEAAVLHLQNMAKEIADLNTICSESYQVVGALSYKCGLFAHPKTIKALDNLSSAELIHDDVLPYQPWASILESEPNQVTPQSDSPVCCNKP